MPRRLRGVSEHVSAALLALIVLAVGGYVVSTLLSQLEQQRQQLEQEALRGLIEARQALSAALAVNQGGDIHVVLVTGDYPVKILGVYVDDKPATCSLSLTDGTTIGIPGTIPPYSAAILLCPGAGTGTHLVKVVYEGGELVVTAG